MMGFSVLLRGVSSSLGNSNPVCPHITAHLDNQTCRDSRHPSAAQLCHGSTPPPSTLVSFCYATLECVFVFTCVMCQRNSWIFWEICTNFGGFKDKIRLKFTLYCALKVCETFALSVCSRTSPFIVKVSL